MLVGGEIKSIESFIKTKLMNSPKLQLLQESDAEALFHLIQKNKNRFIRFFPITVKKTHNLEASKSYVKELTKRIEQKSFYPFGIFVHSSLLGIILVKSIGCLVK